jgi:hypothetical protein
VTTDQKVSGSNPLGRASLKAFIARMLPLKKASPGDQSRVKGRVERNLERRAASLERSQSSGGCELDSNMDAPSKMLRGSATPESRSTK